MSNTAELWLADMYRWFAAQRYYVQNIFPENRTDTKVVCPFIWTYDLWTFDTGTYCDYYSQYHDIFQ